tara:strand:- start:1004 stop:1243 length:240 start_codon:yes stop_codon:yes gene_type:complete
LKLTSLLFLVVFELYGRLCEERTSEVDFLHAWEILLEEEICFLVGFWLVWEIDCVEESEVLLASCLSKVSDHVAEGFST